MDKARIMVVEDEKLVALAIENCLKNLGYEVPLTVSTGEEAVKRVLEVEPDLVLMDIRLQGAIDGVEAARRIKESFHTPIVYLTAYSEEQTLQRAKITEPFGYIMKPFEERALQATVEVALYKAMMQGKLRRAKDKLETVLRCIAEGVVVATTNGEVEYLNPTAQALLAPGGETGGGAFIGEILRVFDADTLQPVNLPVSRVIMNGESVQLSDLVLQASDQRRLPVDFSLAPLKDENNSTRGMVIAFRDVTERRRMKEIVNRELQSALFLQKSLLPAEDIRLPGVRARWLFHSASLTAGDLFNVMPIDAAHVALYMFDVAGHGISAAVNSLLLNRFLTPDPDGKRMPLLDADPLSPQGVVESLAGRFSFGTSMPFFSLLYAVIDVAARTVTFVRAGQPNPILQESSGAARLVKVDGQALGVLPHAGATISQIKMGAGDRLYVYSDAVVECTNPSMEQFGVDRLVKSIEATRRADLLNTVAAVDEDLLIWRGNQEFEDDVCLLAVEVL